MIQKLRSIAFLAVFATFLSLPLPAQSGDDFDIEQLPNGTIRVTKYNGSEKDVVIPATISGINVTSIGNTTFQNNTIIQSVVIPDGITEIVSGVAVSGDVYAAFSRSSLGRISIGKGLKVIPALTFNRNKNLTTLIIPDGITEIGYHAFYECALSSITLGKGLVKIGDGAFYNNEIPEITIPNKVTSIAANAFANNKLTVITFPNSLIQVGVGAFVNNPLTSILFPASLAKFSEGNNNIRGAAGAFSDNIMMEIYGVENRTLKNLTRITVPANMAEENLLGFPANFLNLWKSKNKSAGTYVLNGRIWAKE